MVESAVIAPIPAAQPTIGQLHALHTPAGRAGMPTHVTLLTPFVDPDHLAGEPLALLRDVLSAFTRFSVSFRRLARFADGLAVLYAEPEPAAPFVDMTRALSDAFGLLPYAGLHETVVPHLTVASLGRVEPLDAIEAAAQPMLPLTTAVTAAEVWAKREPGWLLAERIALAEPG